VRRRLKTVQINKVDERRATRMWLAVGFLGAALTAQIPPPVIGSDAVHDFKVQRRDVLSRENDALNGLADRLEREKKTEAAAAVRGLIVQPTDSDALTRFIPLPEVVKVGEKAVAPGLSSVRTGRASPSTPGAPTGPVPSWEPDLAKIRGKAASDLLDLAHRSATAVPPQWGLASLCLRDVLEHDPDQAEARRLVGFEPYEGGWARPFAIRQLRAGNVLHPIFGWVPSSWTAHLDSGELPAPSKSRTSKVQWLPAAEADRRRADGNPPWMITTEHFEVASNVPLSESIAFGRRLEAFHEFFFTVMADVVGNQLPMAPRFRNPKMSGESPYRPHRVYYFATKQQYVDHLRRIAPPDIDRSLGYYDPLAPGPGRKDRKPAYFFRDEGGQIEATATLYHEVSHQLLFESVKGYAYKRNVGNYWVFEGLGTFFETVRTDRYGVMDVGDFVGPRIAEAVRQFGGLGNAVPTERFVGLGQDVFNREALIYSNYQQAQALTLFLMRWHDGAYREAFLDYVRDALKGTLRPNSGRSLQDRLGAPYATIDAQILEFLKARIADRRESQPKRSIRGLEPVVPGA